MLTSHHDVRLLRVDIDSFLTGRDRLVLLPVLEARKMNIGGTGLITLLS